MVPLLQASAQQASIVQRVFLIGDSGGFDPDLDEPLLTMLREKLLDADSLGTVVFLGDNIYQRGLPDSADAGFQLAEARLRQQLDAVKGTGGRVVLVPGNHDWDHSGPNGLANVLNQERYTEAYLDQGNTFLPDGGLPGPSLVELAEGLDLIAIDTEWWLRTGQKAFGEGEHYETREEGDFLANLSDLLRRRDDNRLIIVGHHPMRSNGPHGGRFPLTKHIFPLTDLWENAWVPLPLIGSAYPLAVSISGGKQDLSHPRYRSYRQALMRIFERHEEHLVYASGHDHSLQHFPVGTIDYIVSGSSTRPKYVGKGRGAEFTSSIPGFFELVYYNDGSSRLIAHTVEDTIYDAVIHPPRPTDTALPRTEEEPVSPFETSYSGAAAPELEAGPLRKAFLGQAHRDAWTTPVTVPVLNVRELGLRPTQRGGGQQTLSIRLEDASGNEYALRSLAKDPTKTLPLELQDTVARDIVLDQVAILHPYGALLVPPLAEATGVYHAKPRVYFVPDDPALAPYTEVVGGRMMMLEERPDDDMSHAPHFGAPEEVVGAAKMYSELLEDNDHRVDARFFARTRVLDMFMADWDRHEDQFRWAEFDPPDDNGKWFRPIPRDRDWAFNRMNGLFPNLVQTRWIEPKFQEFAPRYGFMAGLNRQGLPQDRRLTSELTPEDWTAIADSVTAALTDSVFDAAIAQWPESIQTLHGEEFHRIMRERRARLTRAVRTYTGFLDRTVDVVMSDKHEEFVLAPTENGGTELTVYKTTKEGTRRKVLYQRTFDPGRTQEVRLYGMGGNDRFQAHDVGRGIRFHLIGGTGDDEFRGSPNTPYSVYIYDTIGGMVIEEPGMSRNRLSTNPTVNRYDRTDFRFNSVLAVAMIGANEDDGLFVGGGPLIMRHRFRKEPFAARHRIRAASAARFEAFQILYDAEMLKLWGAWDLTMDVEIHSPGSFRNFFGLGNETVNNRPNREFYQARITEGRIQPGLRRALSPTSYLWIRPFAQNLRVSSDPGRFISQAGISPSSFRDQLHAGLEAQIVFDSRDSRVLPRRGLHWRTSATWHEGLSNESRSYGRLWTQASTYFSRSDDTPFTFATRAGAEHVTGTFPFWDAATLGGEDNLRGFSSTRFAGRTSLYHNLEARARVKRFAGYLANGQWGVLGFVDHGRVWTDGESSRVWHRAAGLGAWMSLFDALTFRARVGFSEEQRHVVIGSGFAF
ncbi:MAG: BamA/TamA family outer membrane protein [Rhodothermales bacterium]|nr:BamA/TamA family outer membrane protein [Rhodothermales bacterium]MBO6779748.1 BamA/TamA family outer membrane protein [Rhodothermales bacterium]